MKPFACTELQIVGQLRPDFYNTGRMPLPNGVDIAGITGMGWIKFKKS